MKVAVKRGGLQRGIIEEEILVVAIGIMTAVYIAMKGVDFYNQVQLMKVRKVKSHTQRG